MKFSPFSLSMGKQFRQASVLKKQERIRRNINCCLPWNEKKISRLDKLNVNYNLSSFISLEREKKNLVWLQLFKFSLGTIFCRLLLRSFRKQFGDFKEATDPEGCGKCTNVLSPPCVKLPISLNFVWINKIPQYLTNGVQIFSRLTYKVRNLIQRWCVLGCVFFVRVICILSNYALRFPLMIKGLPSLAYCVLFSIGSLQSVYLLLNLH